MNMNTIAPANHFDQAPNRLALDDLPDELLRQVISVMHHVNVMGGVVVTNDDELAAAILFTGRVAWDLDQSKSEFIFHPSRRK